MPAAPAAGPKVMKRFIVGFLVGSALGVAAGAFTMLVLFPFLFPPPMADEQVGEDAVLVLHDTRLREDASGQDPAHWGRGGVRVHAAADGGYLLELQDDFEVGPGPNFWIYLNHAADIDDEDDFRADAKRLRLAKLKSFTGSQVYAIAADDFDGVESVTIWCESFHQYIASANLT